MKIRTAVSLSICLLGMSLPFNTAIGKSSIAKTSKTEAKMSNIASSKDALQLAKKIIDAYGGLDTIKKFQNTPIKEIGSLEQISSISGSSNTLSCELITLKDKQHLQAKFMGQTVITCFDGENCWTQQGDNALPTDNITSKRIKEDQLHGMLLLESLLEPKRQLKLGESKRINGKKCLSLVVTADDGKQSTFFVDPKSYLIVRNQYEGTDTEQGIKCTKAFDFADYREIEGFKSPFQLTEYSGDKKVSHFEVKQIETNIKIAKNFFSLPTQVIPKRLKQGPVFVPFRLISNEVIIKVKVNGEKDLYFLVDTGATQSILDAQAAKGLGMVHSGDFNITTGSGAMKMQFMTLNSMRFGDLTLNNIPVAVAPLKKFSNNLMVKPAGLIGANILKRFLLTIDYPNEKIELRAPDSKIDTSKGILVNTKPSLGVSGLAVEGVLENKLKLNFLLDSGAAFNHVSENLVTDLITDTPILAVGSIKGLDAKMVETGAIKFSSIKIGDLSIKNPIFSIAPDVKKPTPGLISGGNLAIIGNPLLSNYRITIFYQSQKILFEKSNHKRLEEDLLHRLELAVKEYHKHENVKITLRSIKAIVKEALKNVQYGAAGQALAEYTYLAYINDEFKKEQLDNNFVQATKYATLSKNKKIQARVLSKWAHSLLIKKPPLYMDDASTLIAKALRVSPTESNPYSMTGLMLLDKESASKVKHIAVNKPPKAILFLNQSLMLNPSNWTSLWTMYDLAKTNGRKKEMKEVSKLLEKYYPEARKVRSLKSSTN